MSQWNFKAVLRVEACHIMLIRHYHEEYSRDLGESTWTKAGVRACNKVRAARGGDALADAALV